MYFFSYVLIGGYMKEQFKSFVRKNPILVKYVDSKEMTWQQFYEMYDLYGEENSVWDKYLNNNTVSKDITKTTAFTDLLAFLKTINLDSLKEGINSVQRVLGVFQDLSGNKNENIEEKKEYKPRPLYKHFED